MQHRCERTGLILILVLFLMDSPAHAVIPALTPLQKFMRQSTCILTAAVESVDAEKPALVLSVDENLKGKAPAGKLAIHLSGDTEAKKKNHVPQILKRVAPKLPLVLFIHHKENKYTGLAYTNGTWFQFVGAESDGVVRWRFTHGEPYLRKTFKGSTAEMKQTVIDGLAGTKEPPKPDAKEKPGFGPEAPVEKKPAGRNSHTEITLFAVIPTIFVGGASALFAMLFPVLFGGSMVLLRRWLAALSVLSVNSTLYVLHAVCGRWLAGSWWGTPLALWLSMMVATLIGILWAWRRHSAAFAVESSPFSPGRGSEQTRRVPNRAELILLSILSVLCLGTAIISLPRSLAPLGVREKTLLMFSAGLWMALFHAMSRRWGTRRRGASSVELPGEGVLLGTMMLVSIAFLATWLPGSSRVRNPADELFSESEEWRLRVAWRFQPNVESCWFASSPRVEGKRVYIGAVLPSAFGSSGAVYCVDRATGKEIWMFNDSANMKEVFSSPCLAAGRLYIGEGFHQDTDCKLYCLDAQTGQKQWEFTTSSHTESTPCVAGGKVYFGAGDDGLYCLDASSGAKIWHREGLHVDVNPLVIDNRLYCGSGVGDSYKKPMLFCLNAETGDVHWRTAVELPVWGMPTVHGEYIYAALGNGNFLESADQQENPEKPAGALLCLERSTGNLVWRYDVSDSILVRPCMDDDSIWFATRDGHCYCLNRRNGALCWKTDLGSPIVASPSLVGSGERAGLYVASSQGRVCRLDPKSGRIQWAFDVGKDTGQPATIFSSPLIQVRAGRHDETRWIWFGCGLSDFTRGILYCLEENVMEKDNP